MTKSMFGIKVKDCSVCGDSFKTKLRHPHSFVCDKPECKRKNTNRAQKRWNDIHRDRVKEIARWHARKVRNTPPVVSEVYIKRN